MKTLAIIPVLAKNESIPKMYSRFLVKKPLILYICESVKKCRLINTLYIFTGDDNIAHIAEINKIKCDNNPRLINELNSNWNDLILSALKHIESLENENYDYVITLQPNCPLLKSETIDKAIEEIINTSSDTAISVTSPDEYGLRYWKEDKQGYGHKTYKNESADENHLQEFKELSGILISSKDKLIKSKHRIGDKVKLIELAFPENLEIHNHIDWWIAEKYLQRKRILIRVDGYNKIGLGHIYRTLTLANQLIDHSILFVTKKEYELGINLIKEHNYEVQSFIDNTEFEEIIKDFNPHIVINDILDTKINYIEKFKKKKLFVVNFEDLGDGARKADLVINALYKRKYFEENHYWGKDYYILREEFHLVGKKKVNPEIKNILITYGGTDPNNYTEKVLNVINELQLKDLKINVILGLGYRHTKQLKNYVKNLNLDITIKQHISHISKFMYEADLAFTAAGRSVYELASIGTPTIVLVENKRGLKHTFANEKNGIINVGLGYEISNQEIKDVLIRLLNNYELRKKCNLLMLKNNLRSGLNNVISLIFSQYEKFEREQK